MSSSRVAVGSKRGTSKKRNGEVRTYEQVHAGLFWERGKASDHLCGCGKKAQDWAYQHNAGEEELLCPLGRKYSENLSHYAAMCRSCHATLDHRPEQLAALAIQGRAAIAALRSSDPAWVEAANKRSHDAWAKGRQVFQEQLQDPEVRQEHRKKMAKSAAKARAAYAKQRQTDPSAADGLREGARKVLAMRRTCGGCSLKTNPASLGYHQKTTGHRGYT